MDHEKYILSMFLEEDDSFFSFVAALSDDEALNAVQTASSFLDFLLAVVVRGKEKLAAAGHHYDSVADGRARAVMEFRDLRTLARLFDRQPCAASGRVRVRAGPAMAFVEAGRALMQHRGFDGTRAADRVRYITPGEVPSLNAISATLSPRI
ncbi:membrane protein-like protein [Seal parapoxvirus]|uniref:Membrane protein-like protein n=1 Tax=Seal parapoxvirus TaxID=187984 RepID=A0A1Z3GCV0_9POXV|nr:membrane protein-like protein [Seal parapoxvirus]ASC55588.1 membrane protein-like protein [Seal parapoxvirus]